MQDLGLDIGQALAWFPHELDSPYVLVRVGEEHAHSWPQLLGPAVRRCYVADHLLAERAKDLGRPQAEILTAKLPDAGSTMAGDFGEILVYLYHSAREYPNVAIGPKKWRLKQDRTKPAPHSDVLHFVLPEWPKPTEADRLLCSEVKTKSTNGSSSPIKEAIEDSGKDRTSRLARTLVWLRERAYGEDLGSTTVEHLDRFINSTEHPPHVRSYCAVAVICSTLVEAELASAPHEPLPDSLLVVIAVPALRDTYSAVFAAAHASIASLPAAAREAGT